MNQPAYNVEMQPFAMSQEINELAKALSVAQGAMGSVPKNKINPHFKSKYSDLDACWDTARPHLAKNNLAVVQFPSAQGKVVKITTMLLHSSGQWMQSTLSLDARDGTPQAVGSAVTYGRRYGFCSAVGLTSDEDDDGNSSSPAPQAPRQGYTGRPIRQAPSQTPTEVFHSENQGMQERLGQWLEKKGCSELHPAMAKAMDGKMVTSSVLTEELAKLQLEG